MCSDYDKYFIWEFLFQWIHDSDLWIKHIVKLLLGDLVISILFQQLRHFSRTYNTCHFTFCYLCVLYEYWLHDRVTLNSYWLGSRTTAVLFDSRTDMFSIVRFFIFCIFQRKFCAITTVIVSFNKLTGDSKLPYRVGMPYHVV